MMAHETMERTDYKPIRRPFWWHYLLAYRNIRDGIDGDIHEATFSSEAGARAWAGRNAVVGLWIEVREDTNGGGSELIGTIEL